MSLTNLKPQKVCFVTLGCAKNEVDTEDMGKLLLNAGYAICNDASEADAIIVNTCSFIQPAVEEGVDTILDLLEDAKVSSDEVPLIVAGCMPSRYGADLESELPEVAAFVPCAKESQIVDVVGRCLSSAESSRNASEDAAEDIDVGTALESESDVEASTEIPCGSEETEHQRTFAYVKISDGCDRWCSYCTIPLIRGRYHSFPQEQIFGDVSDLVEHGVQEIVLIGQDTGLWGRDFEEPSSLADLLGYLAQAFPNTWFRALYTQPENVTDELIDVVAKTPNICSYLDIPMQHVDQKLLEAMNRKGSEADFAKLIDRIRLAMPNGAIRTTFIAGFPGETEEAFQSLVDFVEAQELDYVGVFPYSREEGTRAYSLPDQLDDDEKQYRANMLRSVADAVSSQVVARRTGSEMPVLIEDIEEDGQLVGRSMLQAPEVDGVTFVDAGEIGSIKNVVIDETLGYDMEGEVHG